MRKLIYIVFFLISFVCHLFPQSHNFKIYSIDEGIPQSQVHTILQDKRGYLWFGTDGGGITRYDGKQFISFTTTEGLCNDLVYAMSEDKDGRFWIGTAKGISIFKDKKFQSLPVYFSTLADLSVRCILIDSQQNIYFGTNKGAFIYNGKTFNEIGELKDKVVLNVYEDKSGNHWFGTNAGAFVFYSDGQYKSYTVENGLSHNSCNSFLEAKNGIIYIATENKLHALQNSSITIVDLPAPSGAKQNVRTLNYDRKGNIWVGTWDCGMFKMEGNKISRYGKNEGLTVDGVYCFFEDKEGNCWIGTDGAGAAKLGKQTFTSIREQNGLPDEMVLSMCKTKAGNWWFGHDGGVSFYDGKTYTLFDSRNGLTDEKVWDVMEDTEGNIWITTFGSGIFKYTKGKFTNYNDKKGLSSNNVRAVFQDEQGRIWIGTGNGLNLFDGKTFRVFTTKDGLATNRFLGFYVDRKKNFWVASSGGGIVKVTEENGNFKFKNYTDKEGLADNVVLCVTEDAKGNIWTANFGGISRLNPLTGEIKSITKKDGLSSNTVYALAFADASHLLVGTNSGIDKLDIESYERSGKVALKHYGKDEGFLGVECNTNSVLKDDDGKIWFGTVKGAFIYNPDEDIANKKEPEIYIANLRLFYENFNFKDFGGDTNFADVPDGMVFPYNQNHMTFDFIGLSYVISKNVKYRYMLEGFDGDWLSAVKENFATYSNIPPGKYTFKVISCNNDGVWKNEPATLSFEIKPPFWQTWWFRVLVVSLLVFGVYAFFKARLKRLKARQIYLQQQIDLKTKELREEKELVDEQNKLIEKKNHSITSSIRYAKRIQESILPIKEKLNELIPESFIFFKPKDIVSGDFYWFLNYKGTIMVAAVDCTGHGVPGAFMSLIGNSLLNDIVKGQGITDPLEILKRLHEGLVTALKKSEQESDTVDGMDITLCAINQKNKTFEVSSSGRSLLMIRDGKLKKMKVGKYPLGLVTKKQIVFEKETLELKEGDTFYLYTDGYCDQFGGEEDEKFLDSNFETMLIKIQDQNMQSQAATIEREMEKWRGKNPQIDDMLVIGIRC